MDRKNRERSLQQKGGKKGVKKSWGYIGGERRYFLVQSSGVGRQNIDARSQRIFMFCEHLKHSINLNFERIDNKALGNPQFLVNLACHLGPCVQST